MDLDGTLAHYTGWISVAHIGDPIPGMIEKIKAMQALGHEVRIFTARVGPAYPHQISHSEKIIGEWLIKHNLGDLKITCVKDQLMIALWDDRATQYVSNSGMSVLDCLNELHNKISKEKWLLHSDCAELIQFLINKLVGR